MNGTIICDIGTIKCDDGTINVMFWLSANDNQITYPYHKRDI